MMKVLEELASCRSTKMIDDDDYEMEMKMTRISIRRGTSHYRLPFPSYFFGYSTIISLLILLPILTIPCEALKILMYQTAFSPSHMGFSGSLVDALVERGHTVDKIIMLYNPHVSSNGSSKLRNVWRIGVADPLNSPFLRLPHVEDPFAVWRYRPEHPDVDSTTQELCTALVNNSQLVEKLKAEHYDLYVTAAYEGCAFGMYALLRIPAMVGYAATAGAEGLFPLLGIPEPPSYVSSIMRVEGAQGDSLDIWAKSENLRDAVARFLRPSHYLHTPQEVFHTIDAEGNFPDLRGVPAQMSYFFLNTNEVVDLAKPISAKVKYVGGIAMRSPKPVPKELDELLSAAKAGVILFSFGSLVKTTKIPTAIKVELFKAFARFPNHTVIWKYDEGDDSEKGTEDGEIVQQYMRNATNIHRMKWIPQVDLLFDGRVDVFISHLGLNSYLEATHAGVPLVAIPILVDQNYNAGCAERLGVAVSLDKNQLSADALERALHLVLGPASGTSIPSYSSSYTRRAKEIARLLKRRPEQPRRVFVDYAELAAEFPSLGTELLQLAAAAGGRISSEWEYWCLDVVAMWAAGLLALLAAVALVARMLVAAFERLRFGGGGGEMKSKMS